jgi:selenocysteine-specific elongation factor
VSLLDTIQSMIDLILGTAGHIDHGKTSLVKALTGVNTDRLPEEKRRGITIELGFAELILGDVRLGIVDVPGHERFVRNMLAGATGIDVALLVIAADDSIKPQTREHFDILKLLNLDVGVVALTKCDLSDPDWIELVEEEIRQFTEGTFLADAPIVRCSSHTGQGLDELRAALTAAAHHAAEAARRRIAGPFRMAIDRTFTIAGHGTVVTGSVVSGRTQPGDELVVEPGGVPVRVRGVQQHDRPVEEVHRGQRAAINLAGIHHDETGRGQELCSPDFLVPSRLVGARLTLLPSAPRPLKNRSRVRLHIGTAEVIASVVLLDCDELLPGDTSLAQFYLSDRVVSVWNQPYVLRSESPLFTIGGGQIIDPEATKIRRSDTARIARLGDLVSPSRARRADAALYLRGLRPWAAHDLVRLVGVDDYDTIVADLKAEGLLREIAVSPQATTLVHRDAVAEIRARVEAALAKLHEEHPLQMFIERPRLVSRMEYLGSEELLAAVLADMQRAGRVRINERGLALAGAGPQLSAAEQKLLAELVVQHQAAGFQPPTLAELKAANPKHQNVVQQLCRLAAANQQLVEISAEFFLHAECEARLRALIEQHCTAGDGFTVSQLREMLGTSRKYAVPICEYLDRTGFTRRQGDLRLLAVK